MGMKKWCVSEYNKTLAKELAAECDIDPIVALIASSRGYTDPTELEQFLFDEPVFSDPKEMADIIKAADIINAVIENGEKIAVYGDYDCDGVTATALLYTYLKSRNADCIYYIPDRFTEGYGMNCGAVEKLHQDGVKLIVTVDNGIKSFEEILLAGKLGMTVVVTDHHIPDAVLPEAAAVVDPHRSDCPSVFKDICGAQVAFRLICVIENKEPEELLPFFADIISLAVIGDVMPLTLENRSIVKCGIEKLKSSPLTGIAALINAAGIDKGTIGVSKISFGLVPRINAAGRIGKADRAVELLTEQNMIAALNIANEIDAQNSQRQQIEKKIYEEALLKTERENLKYDRIIVVSGEGWHHGVIGIAAAKIAEHYGVPAILLSVDGELSTGSGRSVSGFSLYDAIDYCSELLIRFGGHSQAAGITVATDRIDDFRRKINEYAGRLPYNPPRLMLDCKLNPSALSLDLAFALLSLEPFGEGNALPLFGLYGVTLKRITPISNNKHLRLLFSKDNTTFQCLLFGVGTDNFCFEIGDILDLAVNVEANLYKDEYNVSVLIRAIRLSGTDDSRLFDELSVFKDFCAGVETDTDTDIIFPSREQVGAVYKYICNKKVLADRVKYIFTNKIGYGKTAISLITLEELKLVQRDEKGFLSAVTGSSKTELSRSDTYKRLAQRGRR